MFKQSNFSHPFLWEFFLVSFLLPFLRMGEGNDSLVGGTFDHSLLTCVSGKRSPSGTPPPSCSARMTEKTRPFCINQAFFSQYVKSIFLNKLRQTADTYFIVQPYRWCSQTLIFFPVTKSLLLGLILRPSCFEHNIVVWIQS